MNILVIEDDEVFVKHLKEQLPYNIISSFKIDEIKKIIEEKTVDLVILDYSLPGFNGIEIIPMLKNYNLKIIVLTSNDATNIEISCLKLEVHDFIKKPINIEVLKLRIQKYLSNDTVLNYKENTLNLETLKLNDEISLTKNEFIILHYLFINCNQVIEKKVLINVLWENDQFIEMSAFNVALMRLRKKLDDTNLAIKTIPNKGVMLT